jgi:hypothetical protein
VTGRANQFGKTVPHFIYLEIGELYRFRVTHFYLLHFTINHAYSLSGDVGRSGFAGVFSLGVCR